MIVNISITISTAIDGLSRWEMLPLDRPTDVPDAVSELCSRSIERDSLKGVYFISFHGREPIMGLDRMVTY